MADPATPALLAQALTALVSGVIGGLIGSSLKWVEQRSDRTRRRRSIATALLNDLRTVELNARELMKHDYAARTASIPAARIGLILRRVVASDDLLLFSPNTVSRLHYLASLLNNIDELGGIYAKVGGNDRAALNIQVRNKSWFVAKNVAATKHALERDGGAPPPPDTLDIIEGDTPPDLGPPAFTEWTVPHREPTRMWVNAAGRPMPDDVKDQLLGSHEQDVDGQPS